MAEDSRLSGFVSEGVAALETAMGVPTLVAVDFCKAWPVAKSVLEIIAKIPAATWIVGILIAIGDAYYSKHCKGK